jgi:uncharacterized protein (DUF58 family)
MNRKNSRFLIILLLVLLFAVQIQNLALAAPRTALNITADNANVFPGSVFTVTISFTSKDEDISVVQASIYWNIGLPAMLWN